MRRARAHPSRGGRRVRSSRRAGSARAAPGLWRRARLRACRALRASRAGPRARRRRAAGRARERAGRLPRARPARHPRARRDRNVRPGCRVHPRHARARRRLPPSRAPRATARGGAVRRAPRGKSRGTGTPVAARARGHPENRCRRDRSREPRRHPRRAAPRAAGGDRPATARDRQLMAAGLTFLAMIAFAGNSLLCRMALKATSIDPASFTTIRIVSGALALWLIVRVRDASAAGEGNWRWAARAFAYAAAFSFAYLSLTAATGALILFASVQVTMIGWGIRSGQRLGAWQLAGVLCAFAGLVGLLLPGLSAPPLAGATLMLGAGVAWGVYSLRGKGAGDPTRVTAGNFLRAVPLSAALTLAM